MGFRSPNAVMIEVLVTPSNGLTPSVTVFQEQQQLIGRPIVAIETFSDMDLKYSPLSSGISVLPVALFNQATLNLMRAPSPESSNEPGLFYKNVPLSSLRRVQNNYTGLTVSPSGARDIFEVVPMFLQWPDSQIMFSTPAAQAATFSIPFLVHYMLPVQYQNYIKRMRAQGLL